MGNICYKVPTPDFKIMHPDNTVICQVKISRAMKAAQEAAKLQSTCKRKEKIIFFYKYQKHQFQHWCFFLRSFFLLFIFKN
jgi:hypothetical protein